MHVLLTRTFWPGIDGARRSVSKYLIETLIFLLYRLAVSDSLEYCPEKCTVVATYRHLVVGVALLSSPQETYLTYLAVRAGWEDSGIATYVFILFLLVLG